MLPEISTACSPGVDLYGDRSTFREYMYASSNMDQTASLAHYRMNTS